MRKTKTKLLVSLVCMLMTLTTLLGSTYAWFTDSVSNTGNRIQAGTLKIDLLMDTNLDGTYSSIKDTNGDIFKTYTNAQDSNETLWEPGKTQIVYLAVKNCGTLALKYQFYLDVLDHGLCDDGESNSSLEFIIVPGATKDTFKLSSYEKWSAVETAAESYPSINSGDVLPGRTIMTNEGILDEITKGTQNEIEYFALIVHMKEDAGNVYQDKDATIDVYLTATQYTSENDGFGTNTYDANATYADKVDEPIKDIVQKTIKAGEDTVFVSSVTPSAIDGNQTTVVIPSEEKDFTDGKPSTLTVTATPILTANSTFTIGSGDNAEGAVGAIDLKATVDGNSVSEFLDSSDNPVLVLVTTYTAKNMTNVSITYGTETWTQVATEAEVDAVDEFYYDKTTGKLVFATTHFSTFVLGAEEVAYNERNNTAYLTFNEAFNAATKDDTIFLLKDATNIKVNYFLINKDLSIDLNKYKLTLSSSYGFLLNNSNATLIIKNGSINSTDCIIYGQYGNANIENATLTVTNDSAIYAYKTSVINVGVKSIVQASKASKAGILVGDSAIANIYGTVKHTGTSFAVAGNGTNGASQNTTINIYDGAHIEALNSVGIYNPQKGTINMYGGEIKALSSCIGIKSGTLNIFGGKLETTEDKDVYDGTVPKSVTSAISTNGSVINIDSNVDYAGQMNINISGGELISKSAYILCETGNVSGSNIVSVNITDGNSTSKLSNICLSTVAEERLTNDANWSYITKLANDCTYTPGSSRQEIFAYVMLSCIDPGEKVELNQNIVLSRDIKVKAINTGTWTFNLDGHTITGGKLILTPGVQTIISDTDNLESLFTGGTINKVDNENGTYTYTCIAN